MKMIIDYDFIRNEIKNKKIKFKDLAYCLGISYGSFSRKMNDRNSFKVEEIIAIAELLEIEISNIFKYGV